jgi:flagellar biosynthesis protein FliQ
MPFYITLVRMFVQTEILALAPVILVLLAVGLGTAFFQAALQIEDATFSLLPKTIAMIFITMAGGFGLLTMFSSLAARMIMQAPSLVQLPWN